MSDGTWDIEYSRAEDLKKEVEQYCKDNGLECPVLEKHMRIRDVEAVLAKLKLKQ